MSVFIRLIILLKPQLPLMMLGALLSVLTIVANISLLAVSGWFITLMAMAGSTGISVNYFTPAAVIRFLAIVRSVGRYGERVLTHRATFNALAYLRHYFYQQLEPLLPYYRLDLRAGDLLARLQQDIDQLDNFYLRVLLPLVVASISVPLVCLALALISPVVALIMATALGVIGLLLPLISFYLAREGAKQKSAVESRLKLELVGAIGAIKELLVYQMSQGVSRTITELSDKFYQLQYQFVKTNAALSAVTFLVTHLVALVCLLYLAPLGSNVAVAFDPKIVVAITLLILVSFETVNALPLALQILPQTLASARRLFEIIDRQVPKDHGTVKVVTGDICFNNFSFSYPNQASSTPHTPSNVQSNVQLNVLSKIDLTIKIGQKVAIIGASGAGKSTLVNVLMGFWPTANLTIADLDLNLIERQSLRDHIALMSQQGHLFDATIGDNLRLANNNASKQQLRDACQAAGLLDFIDSLKHGFDTWLGQTGTGLSGGQAQRLQFSQLLLRPAQVLILDEPTKGLDRRTESMLINNLMAHVTANNQTLILISHKPLMLQQMDHIVVLDRGQIIDQGNHAQLEQTNGYYRQLLNYF